MTDNLMSRMLADAKAGMSTPKEDTSAPSVMGKRPLPEVTDMTVYPTNGELLTQQRVALQEARLKRAHAFFMDPGAGKTCTCIAEAGLLYQQHRMDGMIVVAPNGPHAQWVRTHKDQDRKGEFDKWADFPWHGIHHQLAKTKAAPFWMRANKMRFGVFAINYEAVRTASGQEQLNNFIERHPRFYLVIDESQKLKAHKSQRAVAVERLARRATAVRLLSGTPMLKGLEDLFSQFYILKPGITGTFGTDSMNANYTALRGYFCLTRKIAGTRQNMIVGYRNEQQFRDSIRPYSTRVTADQFMVGEQATFARVECPMSSEQAAAYRQMKDDLIAEIDGGIISAENALVQMGKLTQLASGYIMDEEKRVTWLGENKLHAIMEMVETLDEPAIIWTPFIPLRREISRLMLDSGREWIEYTKPEDVETWKDMEKGVIVGNQSSGLGVGVNLQKAAVNLYAANNFSAEARWQSLKRTDRIGQTRQVRNFDFVTPGTIDIKALSSLDKKQELSEQNIDALRDMILNDD